MNPAEDPMRHVSIRVEGSSLHVQRDEQGIIIEIDRLHPTPDDARSTQERLRSIILDELGA